MKIIRCHSSLLVPAVVVIACTLVPLPLGAAPPQVAETPAAVAPADGVKPALAVAHDAGNVSDDAPAPLSLHGVMDLFRKGNLMVAAARYDLDAVRADVIAAGVLPNPTLQLNGSFVVQGHPQGGRQSYNVVLDQVVPIAGQVGLRKQVAEEYSNAAEKEFAAAVWGLSCDVREAYVDLQGAQAQVRLIEAGLRDLGRVEKIITERAAAGANPTYDQLRVSVERSSLEGKMADAVANLAATQAALAQAIGRGVNSRALLTSDDIPEPSDPPTNLDELIAQALKTRPDLHAARLRVSGASIKISQVRREYVPSPDIAIGYNYWGNMPVDNGLAEGQAIYAAIGVPLPVFDHGQGRIDRAMAEEQGSRRRMENGELVVRREVIRAAASMKAQVDAWRKYRDLTAGQVQSLRRMAESAYHEGKSGILELLDAYRAYVDAEARAVDLRCSAWRSYLAVQRAVGPISSAGLPVSR